jgi:hypothetical protein
VKALLVIASLLAAVSSSLSAQQQQYLEVQQSTGFVEAFLADLGWRQAVVGRQLPAGAVVTSWIGATARMSYGDSLVTVSQLTHLTVLAVGPEAVRLSVESGGLSVDSANLVYEIVFRGMVVRITRGTIAFNDGTLSVQSGNVEVDGAQERPVMVPAGTSLDLISSPTGPVFKRTESGSS